MDEKQLKNLKIGDYIHTAKSSIYSTEIEWKIDAISPQRIELTITDIDDNSMGEQEAYSPQYVCENFQLGRLPKNRKLEAGAKARVLETIIAAFDEESGLRKIKLADVLGSYLVTNGTKLLIVPDVGVLVERYNWLPCGANEEGTTKILPIVTSLLNEDSECKARFVIDAAKLEDIIAASMQKKVVRKTRITCKECHGTGEVEWQYGVHSKEADCPECDGVGTTNEYERTDEMQLGNCFVRFDYDNGFEFMPAETLGLVQTMQQGYFDADVLIEIIKYKERDVYFRLFFNKVGAEEEKGYGAILIFMPQRVFGESANFLWTETAK
jgi:hypothetical protein